MEKKPNILDDLVEILPDEAPWLPDGKRYCVTPAMRDELIPTTYGFGKSITLGFPENNEFDNFTEGEWRVSRRCVRVKHGVNEIRQTDRRLSDEELREITE